MKTFKDLIGRLKPANKNYNYMQVKELSERMEAARDAAAPLVMLYFKSRKEWLEACEEYEVQCAKPRKY